MSFSTVRWNGTPLMLFLCMAFKFYNVCQGEERPWDRGPSEVTQVVYDCFKLCSHIEQDEIYSWMQVVREYCKANMLTCAIGVGRFLLLPLHRITDDLCLAILDIWAGQCAWWLWIRQNWQRVLWSPKTDRTYYQTCTGKHWSSEISKTKWRPWRVWHSDLG